MTSGREASIAVFGLAAVLAACSVNPFNPEPTSPYRQSLQDFMAALVGCMQEKGYSARLVDQGEGMQIYGATNRLKAKADQEACTLQLDPRRLEPPPPRTRAQWEASYRYLIAQTECMREAGYPVSSPPPLDEYVASHGAAFDPYGDLVQRGIHFSHEDLLRCQHVRERPGFYDW
jgi:hypothetical protein